MKKVLFNDLGIIDYGEAWKLQETYMEQGLKIKSEKFKTGDSITKNDQVIKNHLLVCTHPHVYTLGKSGVEEHLLINNEYLKNIGAQFHKTNRGGDITYHGPGQMVAYPILDLEQFYTDLGKYMRSLEEVIIQTIAHYGIAGERLPGSTGVWIDADIPHKARKICAMGVRSSRWITMHGLALNINTDLTYFNHIVPCGISDKGVTSIGKELGKAINEKEVKEYFLKHFETVFQVSLSNGL